MAKAQGALPRGDFRWIKDTGTPEQVFLQYMLTLDALATALNGGSLGPLTNAVSDAAAAAAGVAIGQLYRNGNAVQIRLT